MLRSSTPGPTGLAALLALALLCGAGCGESDQEAEFQDATEALHEAQQAVDAARMRVEEQTERVGEAEAKLHAAAEELAEAQAARADARSRVGLHATDPVLFRAVQASLLEDEDLADVAIAARVEKGVVTLTGSVPEGAQRDHAGELARDVPGVVSVENLISVNVSSAAPEE